VTQTRPGTENTGSENTGTAGTENTVNKILKGESIVIAQDYTLVGYFITQHKNLTSHPTNRLELPVAGAGNIHHLTSLDSSPANGPTLGFHHSRTYPWLITI
jgi:hypothetical protein